MPFIVIPGEREPKVRVREGDPDASGFLPLAMRSLSSGRAVRGPGGIARAGMTKLQRSEVRLGGGRNGRDGSVENHAVVLGADRFQHRLLMRATIGLPRR